MLALALLLLPACGPSEDVLVIGHRGSPYETVENSLEGFKLAYTQGADGVELDVQYSKDGRVIIMHDDTVDRITTCKGAVTKLTLADLAGCTLTNGEPVALLSDMLVDLATWFTIVFVEIKVPEDGSLSAAQKNAFTDEVVRVVESTKLASKIVIISYDKDVLERLAPYQDRGIVAGWDTSDDSSVTMARKWDMPWALMPVAQISDRTGAIAAGLSQNVAVYQVNSPRQFLDAESAEVAAMMSDSIRTICSMLGRLKKDPPKQKKH